MTLVTFITKLHNKSAIHHRSTNKKHPRWPLPIRRRRRRRLQLRGP